MITWKITNLRRDPATGLVQSASWSCTIDENEQSATRGGEYVFVPKEPTDPGFIPYDQINEKTILSWMNQGMGNKGMQDIEAAVADDLQRSIKASQENGIPWGATEIETQA